MGEIHHISVFAALMNEVKRLKDLCSIESTATERQRAEAMKELAEVRKKLEARARKLMAKR